MVGDSPNTFEAPVSTSAPQRIARRQEEKAGGRDRWKEGEREEGEKKMFKVTPRSIPVCFSEQTLCLQVSKYPEIILK